MNGSAPSYANSVCSDRDNPFRARAVVELIHRRSCFARVSAHQRDAAGRPGPFQGGDAPARQAAAEHCRRWQRRNRRLTVAPRYRSAGTSPKRLRRHALHTGTSRHTIARAFPRPATPSSLLFYGRPALRRCGGVQPRPGRP